MPLDAETKEEIRQLITSEVRTDESLRALAAAQARTEQSLAELAAAQARTEQALKELAQRTEQGFERLDGEIAATRQELGATRQELGGELTATRRELGAISQQWGQSVEDVAVEVIPRYLSREEGIELEALHAGFLAAGGREFDIDFWGEGKKGEESLLVICEAKSRADRTEMHEFAHTAKQVGEAAQRKTCPVMFAMRCPYRAMEEGARLGIVVVPWSYQYRWP